MLTFRLGLGLLMIEAVMLIAAAVLEPSLGLKAYSMLGANHLGGRMAFIAMGLEHRLSPLAVILIVVMHNTMYVLIMYSLFRRVSSGLQKKNFVQRMIRGFERQAERQRRRWGNWSRLVLFGFVWIPLPWTGAAIGSYIAHLLGYSVRETLMTVLPAMWFGVVAWTVWFDELYGYLNSFGERKTLLLTASLIILPVIYYLIDGMRQKFRNRKRRA
jgi:uncharacterized membrane protein